MLLTVVLFIYDCSPDEISSSAVTLNPVRHPAFGLTFFDRVTCHSRDAIGDCLTTNGSPLILTSEIEGKEFGSSIEQPSVFGRAK